MSGRISDRLKAVRRQFFVGRTNEKELFRQALATDDAPFFLLYIYGPGGVGKTTLLTEFGNLAVDAGADTHYIDARNFEPTPDAFRAALAVAQGLAPHEDPLAALAARGKRVVLLFDTCETLAFLEPWLRNDFLPEMPANTLIVMAGRNAPSAAWRTDPGWRSLLHVAPLRNLTPDESQSYLNLRTVNITERNSIVAFTHGHPLAISMVADVLDQHPDLHFEPIAMPDIIQSLLVRLVQDAPSVAHRTALEAVSMALYMTEGLLAHMLKVEDARAIFEWLRTLSFMDTNRYGLFPHDLVREATATDLRWRNPDWYVELHRRARDFYHHRLNQTSGFNQRRILAELMFLHRDNAVVRSFLEFQVNDNLFTDHMRSNDVPLLVEMVRRFEGEQSAAIAAHWFQCQPSAVLVIRDQRQQPAGFLSLLQLSEAELHNIEKDPPVLAAWRHLQRTAPIRPGEIVLYIRHWMDKDEYQQISTSQSRIFLNCLQYYLTTPGMAFSFFVTSDPELYTAVLTYADIPRLAALDFEMEGRRFAVYYHDWRLSPPMNWLELMAEREIAYSAESALPPQPPASAVTSVVVLSEPEFANAVREALRHITRRDELQVNPLVRSKLVTERAGSGAGPAGRAEVLHQTLLDAVNLLQSSPKQTKLYRAIYHTYVLPAPTQELAAELLNLPFSTYRRHLKEGIENVVETLWKSELGLA